MTIPGKIICIALFFSVSGFAETAVPPRPSGPVADFAGIIDADDELIINTLARKLWVEENFGLLVVTVDTLGRVPVDSFIRELCWKWHVWKKSDPEGAVVLVTVEPPGWYVAPGENSRKYLDTRSVAAMTQSMNGVSLKDGNVSDSLVALVNRLSATLSGVRRYSPETEAAIDETEKCRTAATRGSAVTNLALPVSAGVAFAFVVLVIVKVKLRTGISVRARKREPFGNVLSGDGFGGSMLR